MLKIKYYLSVAIIISCSFINSNLKAYNVYISPSINYALTKNTNLFGANISAYGTIFTENIFIGFTTGYNILNIKDKVKLLNYFDYNDDSLKSEVVTLNTVPLIFSVKYKYMLNSNINLTLEPFIGFLNGEQNYYKTKKDLDNNKVQIIKTTLTGNSIYGLNLGVIYKNFGVSLGYQNFITNNSYYQSITEELSTETTEDAKIKKLNNHGFLLSLFYWFSYTSSK